MRLYRAGDCYLQDSDFGLGAVNAASGAVRVQERDLGPHRAVPADHRRAARTSRRATARSGRRSARKTAFPNTCLCDQNIDNGAGLSWDATVAAGATTTISSILTFSPLGIVPLTVTKTADAAETAAGGTNGYTITVNNPNDSAVALDAITDTLPGGLRLRRRQHHRRDHGRPERWPANLSWNGPLSVSGRWERVPALRGHRLARSPGTYTNTASATATGYEVISTGAAARVTVTGTTPVSPLVVTLSPATSSGPVGSAYTARRWSPGQRPAGRRRRRLLGDAGPNAGTEGQGTTDAAGVASFGYPSRHAGPTRSRPRSSTAQRRRTSNTVTRTWTPAATGASTITSEGQPAR